jgi:hypothetical protein
MKRLLVCALLVSLCGLAAHGQESAAPAATDKVLGIVAVGDVDPATVERVRSFVQENLAMTVRLLDPLAASADTLDGEGREVAKKVAGDVGAVVALVMPKEKIAAHGVTMLADHVVVVNAGALKPENGDAETYGRRLERLAMRGFGMLLDAQPCPNPQCALYNYTNLQELDIIGRNYCPPCLKNVQEGARKQGLDLIEDSPFFVR